MKEIYLATDHAGFALKEKVKEFLIASNHHVVDCGALTLEEGDDYPVYISRAALAVSEDPVGRCGIIFGGSGEGEAIVANKYPHIRCAVYNGGPEEIIELSREHNDANILSFGARFVEMEKALALTKEWLDTPFSEDERHKRRIAEIEELI